MRFPKRLLVHLARFQPRAPVVRQNENKSKPFAPECEAMRSNGEGRCRSTVLYSNGRCRMHGGPSTGPRTAEGKERAMAALAAINARRPRRGQV